jgi:hypothetical protein
VTLKPDVARRALEVELLYLDLETCDRCQGTDGNLREAVREVMKILGPAGVDVVLREIHVATEEQAKALAFTSSPTIRVMGRDLAFEVKENPCGSCSDIAGRDITCRAWTWQGREYSTPPKELLVDALLRQAYLHPEGRKERPAALGDLPDNLKTFFRSARSR